MTYRCPACNTPITLAPGEVAPRSKVIYRCTICRLHLVLDTTGKKMVVPPIDAAIDRTRTPPKR